ncbi:MAG: PD-(D/E)XK nuclease family protein [Bacteroidia bacterium]|nr:PD-(D/E)XK nuclease family protein [Bacteroidia bacterium]
MQPTFLDEVAKALVSEHSEHISELCLVVPNKRAMVFLKQSLAKEIGKVSWAPMIVSIQEFLRKASGVQFPESLTLVLELYEVYKEEARKRDEAWDESLESFFSWGEMLLKDFDEVDKYLIPADKLFTNILDLREIDAFFSLTEEDKEALERLWQALRGNKADRQEMEERYLNLWSLLLPVYQAFRQRLEEKQYAYDGMAYRKLAESVSLGTMPAKARHFVFIGFNALLKSEEVIIEQLLKEKKASVFWDVGHLYMCEEETETPLLGKEPGKFIRSYHIKWTKSGLDSRFIFSPDLGKRIIHLVGAPQNIGQARFLGLKLHEIVAEFEEENRKKKDEDIPSKKNENPNEIPWERKAVVLADEQMLFPVLEVIPTDAQFPNVTMGYPLKQTHIYHLLSTVLSLLRNRKPSPNGSWLMAHEDVERLFLHPYLHDLFPESKAILQDMAKRNLLMLDSASVLQTNPPTIIQQILRFPPQNNKYESVEQVVAYLDKILLNFLTDETRKKKLEQEFLVRLRESLTALANTLTKYHQHIRTDGLGRLLQQALQSIKIPFQGEPLKGLQVMGFLETRGLDFDQLFILGTNEGLLPDTSSGNSFIPYLLRKAFGMPTFEEKDAIYAYHFYRFLQRAKETWLVYNRVVSDRGGSKEVSRFIQQIRFFLKDAPNITVIEHQANAPALVQQSSGITIPMTDDIKARLQQRFGTLKSLSPSSLNVYRTCSLQFYFKYIAELKEPEVVEQTIPANLFGTLLHNTLESVYEALPHERDLTKDQILRQLDHLEEYLDQAVSKAKLSSEYLFQGENLLKRQAILKQCKTLLERDADDAPFAVLHTEQKLAYPESLEVAGLSFNLEGTLDRVDKRDGIVRILDYKTGQVHLKSKVNLETLFEEAGSDLEFQGYMYSLLYQITHADAPVQTGFYALKKPSSGIQYLQSGQVIDREVTREFDQRLRGMLHRMATSDFTQTEDEKKCEYCAYAAICQRDIGKK